MPADHEALLALAELAERCQGHSPIFDSVVHDAVGAFDWWDKLAGPKATSRAVALRAGAFRYSNSLDAVRTLLPKGAFWRLGHDGEGPDPSLFLMEMTIIAPPLEHHYATRALTAEGAMLSAALRHRAGPP